MAISDDSLDRIANLFDRAFDPTTGFYIGFKGKAMNQLRDVIVTSLLTVQNATTQAFDKLNNQNTQNLNKQLKANQENFDKLNETLKQKNNAISNEFSQVLKTFEEKGSIDANTAARLNKAAVVIGKIIDGLSVAATQMKDSTAKEAGYADNLRSAGIVISETGRNFANSFSGTAARLGMSSNQFLDVLKNSGNKIVQLGAISTQSNLDVVKRGMTAYNRFKDMNIEEYRSIMETQLDIMNNTMTTDQIRQTNLTLATEQLADRFRKLSMMTGKSIEQITKEIELREAKNLYDVFKGENVIADRLMSGMNFKESWKEYIATGKITEEISRDMAQNPALRSLLYQVRRDIAVGKLSNETDLITYAKNIESQVRMARDVGITQGQRLLRMQMGNAPDEYIQSMTAGRGLKLLNTEQLSQYRGSDQEGMAIVKGDLEKLAAATSAVKDAMTSGNAQLLKKLTIFEKMGYETIIGAYKGEGWFGKTLNSIIDSINKISGGNGSAIVSGVVSGLSSVLSTTISLALAKHLGGALAKFGTDLLGKGTGGVINSISNLARGAITYLPAAGKVTGVGSLLSLIGYSLDTVYKWANMTNEDFLASEHENFEKQGNRKYVNPFFYIESFGEEIGETIVDWFPKSAFSSDTDEAKKKRNKFKELSGITGLDYLEILDLESQGKTVDEIIEHAKRITQIEPTKVETPETAIIEKQKETIQKTETITEELSNENIEINEKEIDTINLSEETIIAISDAIMNAVKTSNEILISMENQGKNIAMFNRYGGVPTNGSHVQKLG